MVLLPIALLLASSPDVTVRATHAAGEVGYPAGALGYDSLMARDYRQAEQQLLRTGQADRIDSAWMINYGLVLLRTGRHAEAERLFRRAGELDDGDLELADGRVVSSREAAAAAMRQLKVSLAKR